MRSLHRKTHWMLLWLLMARATTVSLAWGPEGHIFINRVAVEHIPSSMPAFTKSDPALIEYLANEPDRWFEPILSAAQSPDHFIDLERVEFLKDFPRSRFEFIRALYAQRLKLLLEDKTREADDLLPEHVGFQPYAASEVYERLVVAFRQYRAAVANNQPTAQPEKAVLFYMGWLGHYVGDAANPLHTTINYNGWLAQNPRGFTTDRRTHFLFEGQFVHDNLTPADFEKRVKAPVVIQDVFADYLGYLKNSFRLVVPLYELEKEGGFTGKITAQSKEFVASRLSAAAQKLVDLWYTAWLASAEMPPRQSQQ